MSPSETKEGVEELESFRRHHQKRRSSTPMTLRFLGLERKRGRMVSHLSKSLYIELKSCSRDIFHAPYPVLYPFSMIDNSGIKQPKLFFLLKLLLFRHRYINAVSEALIMDLTLLQVSSRLNFRMQMFRQAELHTDSYIFGTDGSLVSMDSSP